MIEYCQINTSNGIIRGTIHRQKPINEYSTVTLIIHGYLSANRVGPHRLFFQMSRVLESSCNACIARFDFPGMGESDGDISSFRFIDFISAYEQIMDYFFLNYKTKKFFLIGHCIGGNIAAHLAQTYSDRVTGVLLISPSASNENSLIRFFTLEGSKELFSNGYTHRRGLYVGASFFLESNSRNSILQILSQLKCSIVVVESEKDEYFDLLGEDLPANVRYHIVPNADHNYLEENPRSKLFDLLVHECRDLNDYAIMPRFP